MTEITSQRQKKILTVIGARPQFIKHAPVIHMLEWKVEHIVVHTGQHFDASMSDVFFSELDIPKPTYNLWINSLSHGAMTGEMMIQLEAIVQDELPDYIIVYGDTNSTAAAAIVWSKLHIPIIHIEAWLRSWDKRMPEELNRIITDHCSSYLLSPTPTGVENLAHEWITAWVYRTHDPMYLTTTFFGEKARTLSLIDDLDLTAGNYYLTTLHRPSNTDDPRQLRSLIELLWSLDHPVLFPMHPRTRKRIEEFKIDIPASIIVIEPVGYLALLHYMDGAAAVITDSGGLQKEAYILGKNIFTARTTTERTETIDSGRNMLILNSDDSLIADARDQIVSYRWWTQADHYNQWISLEEFFNNIIRS